MLISNNEISGKLEATINAASRYFVAFREAVEQISHDWQNRIERL